MSVTKEDCESMIRGVCEGCGGKLEAINTVDNSGNPCWWIGCNHCSCFRSGIEEKYFKIARKLVEEQVIKPYGHMDRYEYERDGKLDYYLCAQTAGLSHIIKRIEYLLKE